MIHCENCRFFKEGGMYDTNEYCEVPCKEKV